MPKSSFKKYTLPQDRLGSDHSKLRAISKAIPARDNSIVHYNVLSKNIQCPSGFRPYWQGAGAPLRIKWDGPSLSENKDVQVKQLAMIFGYPQDNIEPSTTEKIREVLDLKDKINQASINPVLRATDPTYKEFVNKINELSRQNTTAHHRPCNYRDVLLYVESMEHYQQRVEKFFDRRVKNSDNILILQEVPHVEHQSHYSVAFKDIAESKGYLISANNTHTSAILVQKDLMQDGRFQKVDSSIDPDFRAVHMIDTLTNVHFITIHAQMKIWGKQEREQFILDKDKANDTIKKLKTLQEIYSKSPNRGVVISGDLNIPNDPELLGLLEQQNFKLRIARPRLDSQNITFDAMLFSGDTFEFDANVEMKIVDDQRAIAATTAPVMEKGNESESSKTSPIRERLGVEHLQRPKVNLEAPEARPNPYRPPIVHKITGSADVPDDYEIMLDNRQIAIKTSEIDAVKLNEYVELHQSKYQPYGLKLSQQGTKQSIRIEWKGIELPQNREQRAIELVKILDNVSSNTYQDQLNNIKALLNKIDELNNAPISIETIAESHSFKELLEILNKLSCSDKYNINTDCDFFPIEGLKHYEQRMDNSFRELRLTESEATVLVLDKETFLSDYDAILKNIAYFMGYEPPLESKEITPTVFLDRLLSIGLYDIHGIYPRFNLNKEKLPLPGLHIEDPVQQKEIIVLYSQLGLWGEQKGDRFTFERQIAQDTINKLMELRDSYANKNAVIIGKLTIPNNEWLLSELRKHGFIENLELFTKSTQKSARSEMDFIKVSFTFGAMMPQKSSDNAEALNDLIKAAYGEVPVELPPGVAEETLKVMNATENPALISGKVSKGVGLMVDSEKSLVNKFYEKHKELQNEKNWFYGFFIKSVWNETNKATSIKQILDHAINHRTQLGFNNRTFEACQKLGWLSTDNTGQFVLGDDAIQKFPKVVEAFEELNKEYINQPKF